MIKLRPFLLIAAALGLGLVIYPKPPDVNADKLLQKVVIAQSRISYEARQKHTSIFLGKKTISTLDIRHDAGRHSSEPKQQSLLLRNYIPLVEGSDDVAGRDAWVLRLKPKVKHRPWKQLWVDKKTAVVLASRDWTARNTIKRSMQTISIQCEPVRKPLNVADTREFEEGPSSQDFDADPFAYVPSGFELIDIKSNEDGEPVHWVYSDGLYSISIYSDTCREHQYLFDKPLNWGQGLVYVIRRKSKDIAVVADLLPEEIERIARSCSI